MPDQLLFEIANLDNWFGFRPGMTRAQVLDLFQQLGAKETQNRDEYISAVVHEREMQFWFEIGGASRLRQIAMEDDVSWNGKPLFDVRLDDALQALEPFGQAPMWEANDATDEPFPEPGIVPAGPVADEELLEDGTVWLPDRGLGLVIWHGDILDLAWREPRDLPTQYAGPVTAAQRQLSRRADLEEHLTEKKTSTASAASPKNPAAPFQTGLVWICLGLLAYIGKLGFQEMQLWNQAPILSGKFLSMEEVPRKKYLDLGPERVRRWMPDDLTQHRELYHIEYLDPTGRPQIVTLEGADFYVPPREPGEEVQVAYVAGDPPRVQGPSRVRDVAFIEYMPWAMAVGVFFIIGQFVVGFLPRLLRAAGRAIVPKGGERDPNRPELR